MNTRPGERASAIAQQMHIINLTKNRFEGQNSTASYQQFTDTKGSPGKKLYKLVK